MQGAEILVDFFWGEVAAGEPFLRAALEGSRKSLARESPARGFRLREEPVELGGSRGQCFGCAAAGIGLTGLRAV